MPGPARWLLFIHQIPPRPTSLRVRVWRRLQRIGAVALKSSVYALPAGDETREDFEWVRREIAGAGADATLVEASLVEGMTDAQLEAMFRAARDAEYAALMRDARALRPADEAAVARVRRRYEEIVRREMIGPFACRDEHSRARFAQTRHDGFADALCAACDERALSDKVEIAAHQRTSSALMSPAAEKPKR